MRNHRRLAMLAPVVILVVTCAAPTVEAGGAFGLHVGSGGFGVSVGFGDWGVYTRSWSDPYWSIDFNATLSGYGEWVWVSGLGRVWRPWVATSWRPYTHGRWVSTNCGWTWVAYEPWGYVPHHYGSWAYCSFGWAWVPGYSYSCANVVWVRAGGYVGWYARPPWGWSHAAHGFHHGYHHGYRDGFHNGYHTGYDDGWRDARYATYVDWRHIGSENVSRHAVPHRIASQSRLQSMAEAPNRNEIRRRGGGAVTQTQLSRRTVTMNGREITIARPEGVAPSIERNAADAVGRALSEEALTRRQPLVRSGTGQSTAAARSSRPVIASPDRRSRETQRPSRTYSSSTNTASGNSIRPQIERRSNTVSPGSRTRAPSVGSSSNARQERASSLHLRPRSTDEIGLVGENRSRRAPSTSQRSRSVSKPRPVVQPPRQTSSSSRSLGRSPNNRTSTNRQTQAPQRRTAESRSSRSGSERSASVGRRQETEEKKTKQPSRKRRR